MSAPRAQATKRLIAGTYVVGSSFPVENGCFYPLASLSMKSKISTMRLYSNVFFAFNQGEFFIIVNNG
jgi:hypothetical protein